MLKVTKIACQNVLKDPCFQQAALFSFLNTRKIHVPWLEKITSLYSVSRLDPRIFSRRHSVSIHLATFLSPIIWFQGVINIYFWVVHYIPRKKWFTVTYSRKIRNV